MIARRAAKNPVATLHRFSFPSLRSKRAHRRSDRIDDEGCDRNTRMMQKRCRLHATLRLFARRAAKTHLRTTKDVGN
jgi:hypothetical protein